MPFRLNPSASLSLLSPRFDAREDRLLTKFLVTQDPTDSRRFGEKLYAVLGPQVSGFTFTVFDLVHYVLCRHLTSFLGADIVRPTLGGIDTRTIEVYLS